MGGQELAPVYAQNRKTALSRREAARGLRAGKEGDLSRRPGVAQLPGLGWILPIALPVPMDKV